MKSSTFSPIAIVGRACVLPGALDPQALAELVFARRDALTSTPDGRWGVPKARVLSSVAKADGDHAWTDRGGYVSGFESRFDPSGFGDLRTAEVQALDPLFQWTLHTAREALRDAGHLTEDGRARGRTGAILGNLSFPTATMSRFAEEVWTGQPEGAPDARNRFMSGLPALLLDRALGVKGPRFALDAACASSLYAISLACDALTRGEADTMLAGAVNCADDLFIHIGFCSLQAMSKSGRSRPFHPEADGLIPGEGAAMVVLRRLEDAVREGERILGVIRGVGLSNDGRGKGLLAPNEQGQRRAMRSAWQRAGLDPRSVQWIECHATGTPIGDATELSSMAEVFADPEAPIPIGSLKGNLGHLVTAAGVSGVLKVLSAFERGTFPPTPHLDRFTPALAGKPFRVPTEGEPWLARGPRRAAVSAFGFGGNNAHLVLEEWRGQTIEVEAKQHATSIAVVSIGARVGTGKSASDLALDLALGRSRIDGESGARAAEVELELQDLRFPPNDLKHSIAQQTLLLAAAREAASMVPNVARERASAFVGMGCDPEVARWGARWRMNGGEASPKEKDGVAPLLLAPTVVGTMPNIPANRLNQQLDLAGPSFTVSAEEASGLEALRIAMHALSSGALDLAFVGAVDLSCEPVHRAALRRLAPHDPVPGDAAIVLALMREEDANARGADVLARVSMHARDEQAELEKEQGGLELESLFGRAHAAFGLLHVASAALAVHHGFAPALNLQQQPRPLRDSRIRVSIEGLEGAGRDIAFEVELGARPSSPISPAADPVGPLLTLPAHPAAPLLSSKVGPSMNETRIMQPAPELPPVLDVAIATPLRPTSAVTPAMPAEPLRISAASPTLTSGADAIFIRIAEQRRQLGEVHREFLARQSELHQDFLRVRQLNAWGGLQRLASAALSQVPSTAVERPAAKSVVPPLETQISVKSSLANPVLAKADSISISEPVRPALEVTPTRASARGLRPDRSPEPKGRTWSRQDLQVHASGAISSIFGPEFARQDEYAVQVRMPMEPMLLADRVVGIEATPGVQGKGTVWTETDITWDSWYLHEGRMPAGILIEAGQADLFLISYMGADFLNRGERAYRLLGCELTYHRSPPKPGETIRYDIHVDGHAAQGDVRLFFFHYDCRIPETDEPVLTVRHGQAGFFTRKELDDSAGILWRPETQEIRSEARVDAPMLRSERTHFGREHLDAFADGDAVSCFGEAWRATQSHVRTPKIAGGRMLFFERVDQFDPQGGPWKRGYLRATRQIVPDDWFFPGHFHNDPCMPGTLMFEGCLQAMAFYLAGLGVTVARDGWRFEPVTGETYKMLCRGQVTPDSKELVYEVFIEEFHDGPEPTIYADLLCTVDGLGAFHTRRMGLRLVPDWPITSHPRLVSGDALAPRPGDEPLTLSHMAPGKKVAVAASGPSAGFRFDYPSLLACAWGKPSTAFGPIYERFDGDRKVARLPGPPYHFMSRIAEVQGEMGVAKAGASVVVEYDVPEDAWYFAENGARTMPMCVLMEAALQPCGWLASYVGCALTQDEDLLFRNLDGKGTVHAEVLPDSGTLITSAKLKSLSKSGTMIIVAFDVKCTVGEKLVYTLDTVFGFFPTHAFENQAGLPISDSQRASFEERNCSIDLRARPAALCQGSARLPTPFLLMLDRIVHLDLQGGSKGLGALRAEKDVDPNEWFFKAHFFSDPVQPGSLGIEAMCQLLQVFMKERGLDAGIEHPRFEPIATGKPLVWKYRGQVVPSNSVIGCTLEVTNIANDELGPIATADASLWVDGKRIYDAKGLAMRILSDPASSTRSSNDEGFEETIDPSRDEELRDHCPTWVIPALPAMSMMTRLVQGAERTRGSTAREVRDMQIQRWAVATNGSLRIRTRARHTPTENVLSVEFEAFREAKDARLSRYETAAKAEVHFGAGITPPPAHPTLIAAPQVESPYRTGALFHGPAFHRLRSLRMGTKGSSATLEANGLPLLEDPILLDAMTHGIPHDAMHTWDSSLPADRAAYPFRIERARFFSRQPLRGLLRCEARYLGQRNESRVQVELQLIDGQETVIADLILEQILLPKGPIGSAPALARQAFLRDRAFVPGLGLSQAEGDATRVRVRDIALSNWLPGTIERVYRVNQAADLPLEIAARDHIAQRTFGHPSSIDLGPDARWGTSRRRPLERFDLTSTHDTESVSVRGESRLDLSPIRDFWRTHLGLEGSWLGEDTTTALIERFVRHVQVEDPHAFEALRGRSVLFLANHQVGIESLLFGITISALHGFSTLTLAKREHRDTWLGKLIQHLFTYPGAKDPGVIAYFDRSDPASLPRILGELGSMMKSGGKNVTIHVEGTRARTCAEPVSKMSGVFVDLALQLDCPIVPVRFVGGLPRTPVEERLEFPFEMGRQDYLIGRPIEPSDLAAIPYKERTERVIQAINTLGPGHAHEAPIASDRVLEDAATAFAAERGIPLPYAVISETLRNTSLNTTSARAFVESIRQDRAREAESEWERQFARMLGRRR